jgi:hypothetical protein
MFIEQEIDSVNARLPSTKRPLASLVSQYGLWAGAAASAGVISELFFPYGGPIDVPVPVMLAALFGLGIWLSDINRRNSRSQGWIADTLLGVLLSAVIFKWSYLLTIVADGHFGQFKVALSELGSF